MSFKLLEVRAKLLASENTPPSPGQSPRASPVPRARSIVDLSPPAAAPDAAAGVWCGWLDKKSQHLKRWRRRWFLLRPRVGAQPARVVYHVEMPESLDRAVDAPYGVVELDGCMLELVSGDAKRPFAFAVVTAQRKRHKFSAASLEERDGWLRALRTAIRSNAAARPHRRARTETRPLPPSRPRPPQPGAAAAALAQGGQPLSWPLHRAVYEDDLPRLRELLARVREGVDREAEAALPPFARLDPDAGDLHGNTPLHLACMMGRRQAALELMEAGATVQIKNAMGFTAMGEAIAYGSRSMVEALWRAKTSAMHNQLLANTAQILQNIESAGDFYLEAEWKFKSWVPFVSSACPSDTYKIFKRGHSVCINTTLTGVKGLRWKRGNLAFIFTCTPKAAAGDGDGDGDDGDGNDGDDNGEEEKEKGGAATLTDRYDVTAVVVDNDARKWRSLAEEEDEDASAEEKEEEFQVEVDLLMDTELNYVQPPMQLDFVQTKEALIEVGAFEAIEYRVKGMDMTVEKRREHLSAETIAKNKEMVRTLRDPRLLTEELKQLSAEQEKARAARAEADSVTRTSSAESGMSDATSTASSVTGSRRGASPAVVAAPAAAPQHDIKWERRLSLPPPPPTRVSTAEYFSPALTVLPRPPHLGRALRTKVKRVKMEPLVCMSPDFPLDLDVVTSILELVAPQQSQAEMLLQFLKSELPPGFPVRAEVPAFTTVTATVTFRHFRRVTMSDSVFEVPPGYEMDRDHFERMME